MSVYKITFTPSGSYFFGNEKTFAFEDEIKNDGFQKLYFIRGEVMPSQSTLFGALRYLLLPEKGFDKLREPHNVEAVGKSSFNIELKGDVLQTFGHIKNMSAIFLCNGSELFIPTPFDHNVATEDEEKPLYTPFSNYKPIQTIDSNDSVYPIEYDSKFGMPDSFMSLKDRHLENDLFECDIRIGVNRSNKKDGLFKKEYKCLKKGFSFCVFSDIAKDDLDNLSEVVMLGQGKVPFAVQFKKADGVEPLTMVRDAIAKKSVNEKRVYCLSDMLVTDGIYSGQKFAFVKTRDYRSFQTTVKGYKKQDVLYRFVKAGSVFLPEKVFDNWGIQTDEQKNAATVGLNQIVII